jgi:chromosome partitioning protein
MPVVALIGNKGGAGKTTLCVNLAAALASDKPSIILDADPQQSSLQWQRIAEGHQSVDVMDAHCNLNEQLKVAELECDYCLIDCPPSAQSPQMQQALQIADLAIVPVLPSPLDIWATVHIEEAVASAHEVNPGLKVLLVINQFEARTRLSRLMERALAELTLPTAKTIIRRRAIYRHAFLEGRTVHDVGSRGQAASSEIQQLVEEMEKYL